MTHTAPPARGASNQNTKTPNTTKKMIKLAKSIKSAKIIVNKIPSILGGWAYEAVDQDGRIDLMTDQDLTYDPARGGYVDADGTAYDALPGIPEKWYTRFDV